MRVKPDTSPRHTGIEGADADRDFGTAASFYLDATRAPWRNHFRMETWVTGELRELVSQQFNACADRVGVFGHSMGGHGALVLALRNPGLYRSVSALAPIASPTRCPWGTKAFAGYLGDAPQAWERRDVVTLSKGGARVSSRGRGQGGRTSPGLPAAVAPGSRAWRTGVVT